MRKSYVVLMAAIVSVGFSAALVAQTAPAAAPAGVEERGGGRAGRGGAVGEAEVRRRHRMQRCRTRMPALARSIAPRRRSRSRRSMP